MSNIDGTDYPKRSNFISRVSSVIENTKEKFIACHNQLHVVENKRIQEMEKFRNDTLEEFDKISPQLKELQQHKEMTVSTFKSVDNQDYLAEQLNSNFNKRNTITASSGIEKVIQVHWNIPNFDNICKLSANVETSTQTITSSSSSDSQLHCPSRRYKHSRLKNASHARRKKPHLYHTPKKMNSSLSEVISNPSPVDIQSELSDGSLFQPSP